MGQTPREEMDALLDALLRFAQQMLDDHGEFYPFAAAISSAGELEMVATVSGQEHPDSSEVIELLYEGLALRAAASEIRATGVCADVRVTPPGSTDKTDAIRVSIEHASGDPVEVLVPYRKRKLRAAEYGEAPRAGRGGARVLALTGDSLLACASVRECSPTPRASIGARPLPKTRRPRE